MRVELTDDQTLLHRTVREFAAAELRPHAAQWDRDGRVLASGPTREVLTEDMVRSVYGVDAQVMRHPATGHALVIPLTRSHTQPS